jgi:hypothetical protein
VLALRLRGAEGQHQYLPAGAHQARSAPPPDPGIPLTVPEIRRLLAAQLLRPSPPGLARHWLNWRRRHQARSRWYHQRTRLARDATIALVNTWLDPPVNLPADLIDRVMHPDTPAGISRAADPAVPANTPAVDAATAHADRMTRPWEHDFPVPIRDVVATAAGATPKRPAAPARTPSQRRSRGDRPRP